MGRNRVSVLSREGALPVLAGTGEKGLAGDGGPAARARCSTGRIIYSMGPDGDLYVADTWNNCVRRIDLRPGSSPGWRGSGARRAYGGDGGPALEARFGGIFSIAFHDGRLYACDLDNRRIRSIDLRTGVVATVAGNGEKGVPTDGADARSQPLVDPRAIAFDPEGNLYICERGGHALRVVDRAGKIRTVAGNGEPGFSGDGGPAAQARLNGPKHISVEGRRRPHHGHREPRDPPLLRPAAAPSSAWPAPASEGAAGLGGPAASASSTGPTARFPPRTGTPSTSPTARTIG